MRRKVGPCCKLLVHEDGRHDARYPEVILVAPPEREAFVVNLAAVEQVNIDRSQINLYLELVRTAC